MRRFAASFLLLGLVAAAGSPVLAAKSSGASGQGGGASTSQTGNDVSWPQCGKSLPKGQLFGIVGVNGGLANTTNKCFSTELDWANRSIGGTGQDKAALYVNTANPGDLGVADWPKTGSSVKYGTCTGGDDEACAYLYGWTMARLDATGRGVPNPSSFKWWLDVETVNSWEANTANNIADLEGMVDYFQSIGARVGIYSTAYQWGRITGTVNDTSSLRGLDSWLAGASGLASAKSSCGLPGLTGGHVGVTQFVAKNTDYDYSCE